ncbi:MAG: L-2-amino-thiazoline-4-carboxylic acid hydrolase [Chloroflexota bacterium]
MARGEYSEEVRTKILNGYRSAGTIFRTMVEEMEERFGKELAHEVACAAVRRKGLAAGQAATKKFGKGSFQELAAAHHASFADDAILELSETRYAVRDNACGVVESWRAAGLSPERIKELADIYCWGDLAFAQAFNPDIELEFVSRIAEGKPYCHWLFTLAQTETE